MASEVADDEGGEHGRGDDRAVGMARGAGKSGRQQVIKSLYRRK